jgi:outer membrane protein OmpA-like peptidoglycan-associated protein
MTVKAALLMLAVAGLQNLAAEDAAVSARSTLDWRTGKVSSVIRLDAKAKGIRLPTERNAADGTIDVETPNLLKETYFSVPVNSSERLGDCLAAGEISLADIERVIDSGTTTASYFSADLKNVSKNHAVALTAIGGLFIRHKKPYEPAVPAETAASRPYSGILIDARGTLPVHGEYTSAPISACLMPRVWSADMDAVYERGMVDPAVAKAIGIVMYQSSTDESLYADRIGTDPLRIAAREVYGQNRTDPVISREDWLKIVSVPENRKLLRDGKVLILCDPPAIAGGLLGPVRDDGYYFTRKSIEDRLTVKKPLHVVFTDTWEGLKLTIYDIRFVADTARVLDIEKGRLDAIADALKLAGNGSKFIIEGHTASVGKPNGELRLSVERAATIAKELAARGIAADRIESTGYGGTRPLATNGTEEGRALNRRVEIMIKTAAWR